MEVEAFRECSLERGLLWGSKTCRAESLFWGPQARVQIPTMAVTPQQSLQNLLTISVLWGE